VPMQRYAWFYAAALVLFSVDLVYGSFRRRRTDSV
jgi:hypothetical protein